MAELYEHNSIGDGGQLSVLRVEWHAMSFTVGTTGPDNPHIITSVKVKIYRYASPGPVNMSITATDGNSIPVGPDLSTGSIDGNTITDVAPGLWYEIQMTPYLLQPGTQYALVMKVPDGDFDNWIWWRFGGGYAGGDGARVAFGVWVLYGNDRMFEIWGTPNIPKANIISIDAPESVKEGNAVQVSVNVQNTGIAGDIFCQMRDTDTGELVSSQWMASNLPGGETRLFKMKKGADWLIMPSHDWNLQIEAGHGYEPASQIIRVSLTKI